MNIWLALSLILFVVTIYLFSIEIFFVAFKLTGLATNKIKFQVASLFTSSGFTTSESELIVNNEKRRKIATACMYTGHVFSVAIMGLIANLMINIVLSFNKASGLEFEVPTFTEWYMILLYITSGLFLLVLILKIPPVNKRFQKFLEAVAINSSKASRNSNYITVLDMYGRHAIVEIVLNQIPEFAIDKPLSEMNLTKDYSINVLSIKRGKRIIDVTKDTMFRKGDILSIYGIIGDIQEVFINSVSTEKKVVVEHINEINLVNNYGSNALVEVFIDVLPKELVDTKIKDAQLNEKYNITVAIIKRKDEYIFVDRNTIIQKGDLVTLYGPYRNIKILFKTDEK